MSRNEELHHAKAAVDAAASVWRQGDCTLGEHWFVHRASVTVPLVVTSPDTDGVELVEREVAGFAVVTQTCDIVRACELRPYVEVCPLVQVSSQQLAEIKAAHSPQFAYLPELASRRLVVDLNRTMSVEKSVMVGWDRIPGWQTDAQLRAFADALKRKCSRFAFPDDFNRMMGPLSKQIKKKYGNNSPEGQAMLLVDEIRVGASPSWDACRVQLMFWFIRGTEASLPAADWAIYLDRWLHLIQATGRFASVEGQIATLDDMTAREYVDSDILDLSYLSEI